MPKPRRKASPNGIPNPFNPQDPDWQKKTTTTVRIPQTTAKKPQVSPRAQGLRKKYGATYGPRKGSGGANR